MRISLIGVLAALALPCSAVAATPEAGTVSPTAKTTTWTGSVNDPLGAYDLAMFFNESTAVRGNETCLGVVCDVYTLEVAEGGQEIRFVFDAPGADNLSVDLTMPDGTRQNINLVEYTTHHELIWDALPGTWTFRTYGSGAFDYAHSAEINLPGEPSFYPVEEEPEEDEEPIEG
jgi:hypothetical protein